MSSGELPILKVLLKPNLDNSSSASVSYIDVTIRLDSSELEAGAIIATLSSLSQPPPDLQNYLHITDHQENPVPTQAIYTPESGTTWITQIPISGHLTLKLRAFASTTSSPLSLHYDQEAQGFLGSGISFLPLPPSTQDFKLTNSWDLSSTPENTKAIWTFGEGPSPIIKIGPVSLLWDSVFMVGPIHSLVPLSPSGHPVDYYGYHYFGDLPRNLQVIKDIHHSFFLKVSEFFDSTPSSSNSFRGFIRNNGSSKTFGVTNFKNSSIFDYDNQTKEVEDFDLIRRMAYEIIHHFLGPSILHQEPEKDWLYQGIKNCLSIYLPFRTGFRTGAYFQNTINVLCTRYYTSPLISLPSDKLIEKVENGDKYAQEQLEARAWAYICTIDLIARRKSSLKRPIEDLAIKPLQKKLENGEGYGIKEWFGLLSPLMGSELDARYQDFLNGKTILLNPQLYGAKTHYLMSVETEVLDFGMDRRSFEEGVVRGLVKGGRAEKAGLREGDSVVRSGYEWVCVDGFEGMMRVVVERGEEVVEVEYWPRGEKGEGWRMVRVDNE